MTDHRDAVPISESKIRRHVIVSGLVQGVFYRHSCLIEATRLGVTGTLRNREDGTVEGDFEGSPAAVQALITWCGRGPEQARVDDVASVDAPPIGYVGFLII
jgi:acylphosphatase